MCLETSSYIVLTDILSSPQLTDVGIVKMFLRNELSINTVITRCERPGKLSTDGNRPCVLLNTLLSEANARELIRSARKMRISTDHYVCDHVFLNADLTPKQRKVDYELLTELKRRRAAGETNLITRNFKLHTKTIRAISPGAAAAAAARRATKHCTAATAAAAGKVHLQTRPSALLATNILACSARLCFVLLNTQSVNNKSTLIYDLIADNAFDIQVLTET